MYNGIQWDTTDNVICVFSKNSACIPIICNLVGKIMFFKPWDGMESIFRHPTDPFIGILENKLHFLQKTERKSLGL